MSDAVLRRALYGTEEPVTPPRLLTAGRLRAELDAGNLRAIRFGGVEAIRAVSFLVRSPAWATYTPELSDLVIEETAHAFSVRYRADVRDGAAHLRYEAAIDGHADGVLEFRCAMRAGTDFVTCRAGFVVLHPAAVAGLPVRVEHADGTLAERAFPDLIDPVQPLLNLRALTHAAAPGLRVACRMEGDVFEMEDQRNWTDASFKTYVRPLERPWPYMLRAGEQSAQSVRLRIEGGADGGAAAESPVAVTLGEALGPMPEIGIGCTQDEAQAALPHAAALARGVLACLVCRYDPPPGGEAAALRDFAALAGAMGAAVELQVVVHAVTGFEAELLEAAAAVREAGLAPRAVMVSAASDLKSTTPGQDWPPAPPLEELYRAARAAFPGVRLGGGMFSYFTELNRKRPPAALVDFVTFSTSPLVHAGDDRSVMESLEALPAVAASARAIAAGKPIVVGPSAIGMRDNPYGAGPLPNPDGARRAMSGRDPRQAGLFNAAWTLGYVARFAVAGAARVALGGPVGDHGLMREGRALPAFPVIRALAALRGRVLRAARCTDEGRVLALCAEAGDGLHLWLANLTDRTQEVTLPPPFHGAPAQVLDAAALPGPDDFDALAAGAARDRLTLDAYAVARLRAGAATV